MFEFIFEFEFMFMLELRLRLLLRLRFEFRFELLFDSPVFMVSELVLDAFVFRVVLVLPFLLPLWQVLNNSSDANTSMSAGKFLIVTP